MSSVPMDIKVIINHYSEQVYIHKFEKLDAMDQFLKRMKLPAKQLQIPICVFSTLQGHVLCLDTSSLCQWQETASRQRTRLMVGHLSFICLPSGIKFMPYCPIQKTIWFPFYVYFCSYLWEEASRIPVTIMVNFDRILFYLNTILNLPYPVPNLCLLLFLFSYIQVILLMKVKTLQISFSVCFYLHHTLSAI